jgi:hypothetical protein
LLIPLPGIVYAQIFSWLTPLHYFDIIFNLIYYRDLAPQMIKDVIPTSMSLSVCLTVSLPCDCAF